MYLFNAIDFKGAWTYRFDASGNRDAPFTGAGVDVTSAPPALRVVRPFLFAVRERLSGTILFIGKVMDPTRGS